MQLILGWKQAKQTIQKKKGKWGTGFGSRVQPQLWGPNLNGFGLLGSHGTLSLEFGLREEKRVSVIFYVSRQNILYCFALIALQKLFAKTLITTQKLWESWQIFLFLGYFWLIVFLISAKNLINFLTTRWSLHPWTCAWAQMDFEISEIHWNVKNLLKVAIA